MDEHGGRLRLMPVLRTTLAVWTRHAPYLWVIALLVVIPVAALELLGRVAEIRIDTDDLQVTEALLGITVWVVAQLTGEEVYAGACERIVTEDLRGEEPMGLRGLLARLPLGRMIAAAVVYSVAVAIGLALFIVPGVVLIAYFTVVGPALVIERLSIRGAFRRSCALVRGHFWGVLFFVVLTTIAVETASDVFAAGVDGLGAPHWAQVLAEFAAEALLMPLSGVGVVVLYHALVELEGRERATGPPMAGP